MKNFKYVIFVLLLLFGIYMLVDHYPPLPLSHEAIGLGTNHMAHRAVGVVFILLAALVFWKWKK